MQSVGPSAHSVDSDCNMTIVAHPDKYTGVKSKGLGKLDQQASQITRSCVQVRE